MINDTLSKINSNYETIILVGPNHLNIGKFPVQISSYVWQTKFGEINPNLELINLIKNNDKVSVLEDYFDLEHSICGLITFLKKYFPEAKVLPLMLRNDINQNEIQEISEKLSRDCENCLVIASVDFSHEVSSDLAFENDSNSILLLREKNLNNVENIVSDCYQCITFLYSFLDEDDELFIVNNSNSYNLSGESESNVTSYITGYYAQGQN